MAQPEEKARKCTRVRMKKRSDGSARYLPGTYDWRISDTLTSPPLSCRWGPVMLSSRSIDRQRLYLSYKASNTLIVAECLVVKTTVFSDVFENEITDNPRSPYVRECKTIIAPGEVGRIRELPEDKNIVATLSHSHVHIWDIKARCNESAVYGTEHSCPNLELSGHEDKAKVVALALSRERCVLSGGNDKNVLLWNIQDHTTLAATGCGIKSGVVSPRATYWGHRDTVEDVQFHPSSSQEFCSVGDDSCLILWDARVGNNGVAKVEKAHHGAIIHSVDWNRCNETDIITGSDNLVKLFDRRSLAYPLEIKGETAGRCVQWWPDKESIFVSSSEDGKLSVWDVKMGTPHLCNQYAGHRGGKIVDIHWNESDSWTIASLSDDSGMGGGRIGRLQIWRLNDLEYRGGKIVDIHWNESDSWTIASLSDDSGMGGGRIGRLQIWRLNDLEYRY